MLDVSKPLIDENVIQKKITKEKPTDDADIVSFAQTKGPNLIMVFSGIILALFVGMSVLLFIQKLSQTSAMTNKQEEYNRLTAQVDTPELQLVDQQAQVLDFGTVQYNAMLNKRNSYIVLLEALNATTPEGVSLTAFSVDDKNQVSIDGSASSDYDVSLFVTALNESDVFSNSQLVNEQHSEAVTGSSVVSSIKFSINSELDEAGLKQTDKE